MAVCSQIVSGVFRTSAGGLLQIVGIEPASSDKKMRQLRLPFFFAPGRSVGKAFKTQVNWSRSYNRRFR